MIGLTRNMIGLTSNLFRAKCDLHHAQTKARQDKMPLTRNLYEIDEVVSALQICLRNGWSRGLFWLWELVISEEQTLATNTMTECWIRWGGGHDPQLLSLEAGPERWVRTAAAIRAAGSLTAERLLPMTITPVRPSVTPKPKTHAVAERRKTRAAAFVASLEPDETPTPEESANFWISFDSACRQGSRSDALWLLQAAPLSTDALWSALRIAARGPHTADCIALLQQQATPTDQLLFQVAATLHLCIPTAERSIVPVKTTREQGQWTTWTANVSTRKAREHAIPPDALHQGTTRGAMSSKYTNIGDIREPVATLAEGCAFWQKALAAAGIETDADTGSMVFPDDEALEAFYDRHFPNDIPDEWSKSDQEKSHGRGCQETAPPAPLPVQVREEPVDQRAWKLAIHVR